MITSTTIKSSGKLVLMLLRLYTESRLLSNDLIILRNHGEDHRGKMEHQEGAGEPRRRAPEGGEPIQFGIAEFEFNSESRTTSYSN
jgi:hypothetical protein